MELRAITFDSTVIIISSYHVYISHFFVSCCFESNLMWWCSLGSCSITLFWENWMCSTTPHKWCLLIVNHRAHSVIPQQQTNTNIPKSNSISIYLIYLLYFSRMLNICVHVFYTHKWLVPAITTYSLRFGRQNFLHQAQILFLHSIKLHKCSQLTINIKLASLAWYSLYFQV